MKITGLRFAPGCHSSLGLKAWGFLAWLINLGECRYVLTNAVKGFIVSSMAIENRLYGAADLVRILGVKPAEAYLWSRTWGLFEPRVRAKGPRGRNRYDFQNLLDMALIRELLMLGISLDSIRQILKTPPTSEQLGMAEVYDLKPIDLPTIWEQISKDRVYYETGGGLLIVDKGPGMSSFREQWYAALLTIGQAFAYFRTFQLGAEHAAINFGTSIFVDLLAIIRFIEKATGEKL